MNPPVPHPDFSVYTQFNDEESRRFARLKNRIHALPKELFPSEDLPDRLARSLAQHRVVHIKELLEAFEFFAKVRRRVRAPLMIDLCAGHGLAGLIFALCEPKVTRVRLIDERRPESFPRILESFVSIAPWVKEKITYEERELTPDLTIESDSGVLLVHACGALTDKGIELSAPQARAIAAMPCCYGNAYRPQVPSLNSDIGYEKNVDVSRSHRLAGHGYQVDWTHIPEAITPMNRVIVAWNSRV